MTFEYQCESIVGRSAAVFGSVRGLAEAGDRGLADVTVVDGKGGYFIH